MITAKGTGFLATAIAIYLLARLSQVGWLYLMDAVLWGILIVSLVLPWMGVAYLRAERRTATGGTGGAGLRRLRTKAPKTGDAPFPKATMYAS